MRRGQPGAAALTGPPTAALTGRVAGRAQRHVPLCLPETASPPWSWARLLKRVLALDMARCPWCQRGALRIIAAITHGEVIRKILCHLKLAADPPPIAPARVRQEAFSWSSV